MRRRSQPKFQRLVNQLLSSLGDALAAAKRAMIPLPLEDPDQLLENHPFRRVMVYRLFSAICKYG